MGQIPAGWTVEPLRELTIFITAEELSRSKRMIGRCQSGLVINQKCIEMVVSVLTPSQTI